MLLAACGLVFTVNSCKNDITVNKTKKNKPKLRFSYFTAKQYRAARAHSHSPLLVVSAKNGSSQKENDIPDYGCFVEVKQDPHLWKYWSVVLDYSKEVAKKAEGKKVMVKLHTVSQQGDSLLRLANCVVPLTQESIQMVRQLGLEGLQNIREENLNQSKPASRIGAARTGKPRLLTSQIKEKEPNCYGGPIHFGAETSYGDITLQCDINACWMVDSRKHYYCQYVKGPMAGVVSMAVLPVKGKKSGRDNPGSEIFGPGSGDDSGIYAPPPGLPPGGGSPNPCTSCGPGQDGDPCNQPRNSSTHPLVGCEAPLSSDKPKDCAGEPGGVAYIDACGVCVGGTTGKLSCCASFDNVMELTLSDKIEGGIPHDTTDLGGLTNRGIAWDTWQDYAKPDVGVKPSKENLLNLSKEDAMKIYKNEFWYKSQAPYFLDGDLTMFFFDFYINIPTNATKRLQKVLIGLGYDIKKNGFMGDHTRNAVNQAIKDGKLKELYNGLYEERIKYYKYLDDPNHINGWLSRVHTFNKKTSTNLHNVNCNIN